MRSLEFLVGLLDLDGDPFVTFGDLIGPHGEVLRAWQRLGVVSREPGVHPAPCCPYCDGTPYRLGDRHLCNACRSLVDPRHLLAWPVDRASFLRHLAERLHLRGGVRPVEDRLWQLGTGQAEGAAVECFYRRPGPLTDHGEQRLAAYRRLVVLYGMSVSVPRRRPGVWVPAVELFDADGNLRAYDVAALLRPRGGVRFDAHSGALWLGDTWLGEVPVGSKEFHLLAYLAEPQNLDRFVAYGDLKREVLRRSGGNDETDEASLCHGLKRRLKRHGIAAVDRLIVTNNKAGGYRLRAYMPEPSQN